jgi:hypothetical protein
MRSLLDFFLLLSVRYIEKRNVSSLFLLFFAFFYFFLQIFAFF